jgi:hypothetical protein
MARRTSPFLILLDYIQTKGFLVSELMSKRYIHFDTRLTIKAHSFESTVSEHFGDLGVLLTILLEHQLSLLRLVLVLSSTTILSSFSFILWHVDYDDK